MPAPQPCLPKPAHVTLQAFRKRRLPAPKSLSAAGRAVGQAPQPFPGPFSLGVSKAPFARPQKPLGSRQGRLPNSTALPGTFGCTCLHRSLACQSRRMSLFRRLPKPVHSKAPFARPQKPLGSRQGRLPGSTALPGTFGCTCLHRSLACQSRCMSLFRRFESVVCPPPKSLSAAGRAVCQAPQPFPGPLAAHACTAALPAKAGACHSLGVSKAPFARPQKPLGSRQGRLLGSTALPGTFGCTCLRRSLACPSRCMSLFRRFESAVCPLSKASRQPAGPLARLHSPSRDLSL